VEAPQLGALEAPQLRPLGVGDIVDRVFNLYRQRPLPLIALATVPYLALILCLGALVLAFGSSLAGFIPVFEAATGGTPPARLPPAVLSGLPDAIASLIAFILLGTLVAIVLLSAQTAAIIQAMTAQYLGRPTTVADSFRAGVRASPKIIVAGILIFVAFIALWAALVVVFVATNNGVVIGLGVIAGLVASVFLFASWVVAPCVVTIEGVGPIDALRRSWTLSHGNRWRIIGLQLLLVILQVVLSTVLSAASLAAFAFTDQIVRFVIQQLMSFAAQILWVPIEWGATALLYIDLRIRREGYDLQLAAEALPRDA
jgi:hypothetical protein